MTKKTLLILCLMFVCALIVRTYKLGVSPESLTWDEAALSYNTYSLLETGKDEYGHKLPLVLRSFDDYKPALYAYLSVPIYYLNGMSIFSIRLLSAIAGSSMVVSMFLFGFNLSGKRNVGLICSLLVVFSPIFLLYSRMALEANLSLAFFVAGLAFITKKESTKSLIVGQLFFLLSAFAYHSARYVVPILVLVAVFISFSSKSFKNKFSLLSIFGVLYLPIAYFVLNPRFNTRFDEISVFTNKGNLLGTFIDLGNLPNILEKISRAYFYSLDLVGRYLGYFNPYNIFIKSSGHDLYHLSGVGILNMVELPFWILGGYLILKNYKKISPIFFAGLFVTAIPAAVTIDWFSPLRAALMWPFHLVIIATGVEYFGGKSKKDFMKKLVLGVFAIFWFGFVGYIFERIFYYRNFSNYGAYQYGFAQTAPYVAELIRNKSYDHVIVDSPHAQPHIFWLVYTQYPPEKYQKEIEWRVSDYMPRHNFDFGQYTFREIYFPNDKFLSNSLFVGDTESLPYEQIKSFENAIVLKEFLTPDGNISFRIVEIK